MKLKLLFALTGLVASAAVRATPGILPCDLVFPDDLLSLGLTSNTQRVASEHVQSNTQICELKSSDTKLDEMKKQVPALTLTTPSPEELREFIDAFVAGRGKPKETAPFMQVTTISDQEDMLCQTVRVFSAPPITALHWLFRSHDRDASFI